MSTLLRRMLALALSLNLFLAGGPSPAEARMSFAPNSAGKFRVPGLTNVGAANAGPAFSLSQLPAAAILDHDPAQGVTADGSNKVTAWAAKQGTGTFTSATSVEQPSLVPDGWSTGIPLIRATGSSTTGAHIMRGNEAFVERWWDFLVLQRPNADQNAVATSKWIMSTGRLSDSGAVSIFLQRTTSDPEQDDIYSTAIGSQSATTRNGFTKGSKGLVWGRTNNGRSIALNGGGFSAPQTNSTGTQTQTTLFGNDSAISSRASVDLARRLRINTDLLPGKDEQLANGHLVEGYLAWTYGSADLLRADHPYKTRAPLSTDYSGQNRLIIGLGNSLTFGTFNQMSAVYQAAARGLTSSNQGISGDTPEGIYTRFQALAPDELLKVFYLGDVNKNPSQNGTDPDVVRAQIISAVETAQGRGVGNAHLVHIGEWVGFISGSTGTALGSSGRTAIDAKNAALASQIPNYYFDVWNAMVALGAPDGAYPDAIAYAKGWIPDALRDGSTLHLNTLGYTVKAQLIAAFVRSKGWDL